MKVALALIIVITMMTPISVSAMTTTELPLAYLPNYYEATGNATYTLKRDSGEIVTGSMIASPKAIPKDIEALILQNTQYRVSTKNQIDLSVQGKNKRSSIDITGYYGYWNYIDGNSEYIYLSNKIPITETTDEFELELSRCFLYSTYNDNPIIILTYENSESANRAYINLQNTGYIYIQCAFTYINEDNITVDIMQNTIGLNTVVVNQYGNTLSFRIPAFTSVIKNGEEEFTELSYMPKIVFHYTMGPEEVQSIELVEPIKVDKSGTRLQYKGKSQSEKLIQFITDRRQQDWSIEYQEASTGFASFIIDSIDGFASAEILPSTKLGDIILIPLVFTLGFAIIRKIGT